MELIQHGADINAFDSLSFTPLHYASSLCLSDSVEALIRLGADVNARREGRECLTPLESAVKGEERDRKFFNGAIHRLLLAGAKVRGEESRNNTTNALHLAIMSSNTRTFTLLLDTPNEKIDVNCKNNEGDTALLIACKLGKLKKARLLARHGADPNIAGEDGITPLSMDIVKFTLLEDGLDIVLFFLNIIIYQKYHSNIIHSYRICTS